jgi:hypothetical protein
MHHAATVAGLGGNLQALQCGEKPVVNEVEQGLPGDALRVRRPVAPLKFLWERRAIIGIGFFQGLILIVDNLEEEQPGELADALRIAIDAHILAHDVLNGFDGCADDHGLSAFLIYCVLHLANGLLENHPHAERLKKLAPSAKGIERRDQ